MSTSKETPNAVLDRQAMARVANALITQRKIIERKEKAEFNPLIRDILRTERDEINKLIDHFR